MSSNRGLAFMGPGKVEIQSIDFPELALGSRKCEHGVILKIVSTNIPELERKLHDYLRTQGSSYLPPFDNTSPLMG